MKLIKEVWYRLSKWAVGWLTGKPHFVIGNPENPYMLRWYVLPRNPFFNVYLHKFLHDDEDRATHDHPWRSLSIVLSGNCLEHYGKGKKRELKQGSLVRRSAEFDHRIQLLTKNVWTLFITGPTIREWGFHCPQGWRHWKEFTNPVNSGEVGKGCD